MTSKCVQSKKQNVLDSRLPRILLACWLLAGLFFLVPRHGRSQTQELHSSLDNATRTEVVEAAAKALEERYIFADVARAMAKELRAQNAAHAYDTLTSRTAFSKQLTADLYAIAHDKHIHVGSEDMRPGGPGEPGSGGPGGPGGPRPGPRPGGPGPGLREPEGPPPSARVTEFKRLPGNVGYLRVDQMLPADSDNMNIDTAMASLVNSNALIIDLRHNGGGDPRMVADLCTYLFPAGAKIHLSDFVGRDDPTPRSSYTLPSVPGKTFAGDVYILTSHFTFSGGEEMSYDLQALKRATIVGETTGGGANPGGPVPLPGNFSIFVPTGRPINPITKTNWEGVGVQPDVVVPPDKALEKAELLELKKLQAGKTISETDRREIDATLADLEAKFSSR
jgi:retinol-binding protein 3